MLLERKDYIEEDGSIGYIESVFNSGNVLKTTYFPKSNLLYIAFSRGDTYSYSNVTQEIYDEFEQADSQGKFFFKRINKKDVHPYRREFSLYPNEVKELREVVKKRLDEMEDDDE
jgi:hypothetical protein